ncbi:hypothetical protein CKO23_11150 [Thiocystis violacea]|nr:hypothetical protein [Thiocystis violacea]
MRTLHLFAGAGGGLYADLILGHGPIAAVEHNTYCCAVLRARAAEGWWPGLIVHETDIRDWNPSDYTGRVDCLHAGFPCQDISLAGRGAGIDGERSGLWSEVARTAGVLRPRYLFLENSPAILVRGLSRVLADLASLGYDARWCVLGAAAVGAPHLRARWWCLATRADAACHGRPERELSAVPGGTVLEPSRRGPAAADPDGQRLRQLSGRIGRPSRTAQPPELGNADQTQRPDPREQRGPTARPAPLDWWGIEPRVDRVVHGVADRSHRVTALGNGQVPLQAAVAWHLLGGP